jgi:hypothetical protein
MSKPNKPLPQVKIIGKPSARELLKEKYGMFLRIQADLGKLQASMFTILEVEGWTTKEANAILGAEVFVDEAQRVSEQARPEE